MSLVRETSESIDLHCVVLSYYRPILGTNKVDYVFVVVLNHEFFIEAVREMYSGFTEEKGMPAVVFESTEVELNLPFSSPITVNGWKIQPLTYPMISKVDVENFQSGRSVPACNIELEWIYGGQQQQLFHKVTIIGAKEPQNVFVMRYYPKTAGYFDKASEEYSDTLEFDMYLVDEPKSDHICPVCTNLLTEPFLTECGHHVCGSCCNQIQTDGKSECPVCREPNVLSKAQLNKHFQREVNSLRVRCQYYKKGCKWVGEVRNQHDHLDSEKGSCIYAVRTKEDDSHQAAMRQGKSQTCGDLSSVTYKYEVELAELKRENEMMQAKFDMLRASHQQIQADLNVEKELQAKLIQAMQSSKPTEFLIMQLQDKLLAQQAASSLLSVSHQRGLDIMNAIKPWSVVTVETSVQASSHAVAKDFLRGVEAYGEAMLEVVGDKSQKLEWPGYGFYIEVPDGALLPDVTAHVAVKVILAGQFELPEDSQLISAIYWVSSSEVFLKEVAVNIQHCAVITSEERCSEFKFIVARCSQDVLPYKFKKKDGLFNMHTHYATIKVKQFSFFGLTSPWSTELQYMSLKFYKPIANTNKVDYVFVLVRNHELYVKAVRQEYDDFIEDKQMQAIEFKSTEVVLDLPFLDPKIVDGWKIQLLTCPKLTKADVKQFQPGKPLVPACTIELEWIGEGQQQQQLFHKVTISGAKEPNFFYMRYHPEAASGATGVTPSLHHQSSTATHFSPQQLLSTVANLSNDEIKAILRENYVELHGAMCVNPAYMARKLYARGFITECTLHMATSTQTTASDETKADALMEGSQTFMLSHESQMEVFAVFLGILEKAGGTALNVTTSILERVHVPNYQVEHKVVETVMKKKHLKLGSNVQMSLVEDGALLVPDNPIGYQVNPLVAKYLKKKPEAVYSALSHLEVKFVIEDDILVTPTSASPPDWQLTCKHILSTLTTQKIVVVDIPILKEAREEIFTMVMIEYQINDFQFHFDSSESMLSLAGEATAVSSLEDKIKQVYDTVVKREEVYKFLTTESFIFFERCQLTKVISQYPKLTLTMDHARQSLIFFGCIQDLIKLKEQLPDLCKHSKILIPLKQLELKFVSRVSFAEITSGQPIIPIAPFLKMFPTGAAEGYYLLCSFQYTKTAESIARSIREKLNVKSCTLPKSFEINIIDNPEFQLLVQKLEKEHKYEYDIQGDKLVVVGIGDSAVEVSKAIISYAKEKCAVTRDIHLIKGVWQLLNFKMKPTLTKCLDDIQDLGIQISHPKPRSSDPIIKLKGEPDEVDMAAEYVKKMQSTVCQGRLPCELPEISNFFMDLQGQHILKGIEAQTGVCIEMNTASKKISTVEESSQHIHVCTGTTTEFKAVHVYSSQNSSKYQLSSLNKIKVINGSIIDAQVDAIVNTTDIKLGFGGAMATALLKAAGNTLRDECAKKAPVLVGSVTVTGAGKLQCKHILHVVLPNYDGPGGKAEQTLSSVVQKCLKKCSKLKLKSVGIPSIGTGTLNYPDDLVAQCLLETTASYMEKNEGNTTLNQVLFIIFSSHNFLAFQHHLNTLNFKTSSSLDSSLSLSTHIAASSASISETEDITQPLQEDSDVYTVSLTAGHMLVVLKGDISDNDSNVIVNTTNEYLNLSRAGAVSAAILRKGGHVLQQACNSVMAKRKQLEEGEVEATEATGALKCHEVFHIFFKSGDDDTFIETILACLRKAEEGKHQSIAFPAIGTDVSRYPSNKAASGMVQALQRFISSRPQHLRMIQVVLFQQELYEEFVEAFKRMSKETIGWTAQLGLVYSQVKATGAKAFKSLLSASKPSLEDEDTTMTQDWEVVQSESFGADLSVDKDSVVFTIFGEMEGDVKQAEKKIKEVLSKQFVTQKIEDQIIGQLEQQVVDRLEKEASLWQVHIEIDTDPELPMINLWGCLAAVLTVKDKIRDILSDRRHEKTLGAAASAVHQRIKWTRELSDDDDEYDVMLNYNIEEAYKQKKPIFTCEEDRFFIDFRTMEETDIDTGLVVEVKRIDLAEAEKPADWEPMPIDQNTGKEVHVHLVDLKAGTPEYCRVENQFTATMVGGTNFNQMVSIQRVQNSILYGQYLARKEQMDKHNPKSIQNERWLFHGTSADTCAKINSQGFNRVKHGVVYGKGVFARDASYSTRYAPADSEGKKRMYLFRVLTGEYTVGNDQIMVLSPKNPQLDKTVIFDSTVDTMSNPSIFVVFNDAQTYPAYIITYK